VTRDGNSSSRIGTLSSPETLRLVVAVRKKSRRPPWSTQAGLSRSPSEVSPIAQAHHSLQSLLRQVSQSVHGAGDTQSQQTLPGGQPVVVQSPGRVTQFLLRQSTHGLRQSSQQPALEESGGHKPHFTLHPCHSEQQTVQVVSCWATTIIAPLPPEALVFPRYERPVMYSDASALKPGLVMRHLHRAVQG
jgi:hypothetical protein